MRAPRARGFTLLETLLVIGIICATAGIVYGVMAPAREKARQAVCSAQMHQIGRAFMMYHQDYDGVEPAEGVRYHWYEVGFPCVHSSNAFLKAYGLLTITKCPSDFRYSPPGYGTIRGFPAWRLCEEEKAPDYLATMGTRFPMLICPSHNDGLYPVESHDIPEWTPLRVWVLRYDQSLSWRWVRAKPEQPMFLF